MKFGTTMDGGWTPSNLLCVAGTDTSLSVIAITM